jgi:surface polysaccharide O-acyltransferase-like enzyme
MAAVVVLHVGARGILTYEPLKSAGWWTSNLFEAATRWCVPVFVMLSGALLLDPSKSEPLWTFYRKRLSRIGIPLVFWSAFFLAWQWLYHGEAPTAVRIARRLIAGTTYYHLHFMYVIAGLYVVAPMLRVFVRHADRTTQALAVAIALACACAATMIGVIYPATPSMFTRFVPYIGYFLAGACLRDIALSRRGLLAAVAASVGAMATTFVGTGILVGTFGIEDPRALALDYFLSPTSVVLSLAVFLLIRGLGQERGPATRAQGITVRWLAPATLGMYLVHPVFLELYENAGLVLWPSLAPVGLVVASVAVFASSLLATLVLQRIPIVRYIVG